MQGGATALDFFEDAGRGRGPDEALGMLVVLSDVVLNGGGEFDDATKDPEAQAYESNPNLPQFNP